MKKSKLIRQVAVAFAIVFMSAVLCGAGCSNVASDSGGGSSGGSGASSTMTEAEAIAAINALQSGGSITIKLGSSVKTISTGLQNALNDANKKVVLDLSESGVDISVTGYSNKSMFNSCLSLVEVKLPKAATKIGQYLFYNCSSLRSVEIPSSVTSIDKFAFEGCSSLTNVEIPSGVTSISTQAFYKCSSLTSVKIPSGVTSIGEHAFSVCSLLTSVEIPSSVTSIGLAAFEGCSSLTSVEIPSSVTSISPQAFKGCVLLDTIKYTGTKENWNGISIVNDSWRANVPASGVTCSNGKKYKFVSSADSKLGDEI